jgi:hypothetical protein
VDHLSTAPERPEMPPGTPPPQGPPAPPPPGGPLRTTNHDDLGRNRLTVFFRLILGIPHLLWLGLWGFGMIFLAPVLWIATLVRRRPPDGLHEAYAMYVRYYLHVYAYMTFAADPYPGFLGRPRSYPIDLEVPGPAEHGRWSVAFRLFLALPPLVLASVFVSAGGGGSTTTSTGDTASVESFSLNIGVVLAIAILAWFACLARGRMPQGMRDLLVWALGYAAQVYGYLLFLTPRYPNSDPFASDVRPVPEHPVRLLLDDDRRRNRLTVFFRFILAFPHFVWLLLWSLAVAVSAPFAWLIAIAMGRLPGPLHRFFAAYTRYGVHLGAFMTLGAGPFPGFVGAPGYPIDVTLPAETGRQHRASIIFRLLLALPTWIIASSLQTAMLVAAIGGWFASLFTGRMPEGLRNLIAFSSRYSAQAYAYSLLVTGRYAYSGPGDLK